MGTALPEISYRGSVKTVRMYTEPTITDTGEALLQYTNDFSVFDWGKMPDELKLKGQSLATLTAYIFEAMEDPKTWKYMSSSWCWDKVESDRALHDRLKNGRIFDSLKRNGLNTHYLGAMGQDGERVRMADLKFPTDGIFVEAANQLKPSAFEIEGKKQWDYNVFQNPEYINYLLPIEFVFRFGVPVGSSVMDRVNIPGYVESLGLKDVPKEGDWLPRPINEFFTKHEPKDRHLNPSEAFNYSGLETEQFVSMLDTNLLIGLYLIDMFSKAQLELMDGKMEYILTPYGIKLADAVGPDELRLVWKGVQVSKEPIRQYFRRTQRDWLENIKKAQATAGGEWVKYCREELKSEPRKMDPEFKILAENMYPALTNKVTALSGMEFFPGTMSLDDVTTGLDDYRFE